MKTLFLLMMLVTRLMSDPVSELKEMEEIMMSIFPYNMLLNNRVGPDQLATKIAKVFGIDYQIRSRFMHQKHHHLMDQDDRRRKKNLYFQVNHLTKSLQPRSCVNNVELVEQVEFDNSVECEHLIERKCQTTFVTQYQIIQVEKCKQDFVKDCQIEFELEPKNISQRICRHPLKMVDCEETIDDAEDELCFTDYETECVEELFEEEKSSTSCRKVPRTLCAPRHSKCRVEVSDEECRDHQVMVMNQRPEEKCSLRPVNRCWQESEEVPHLVPVEECLNVPREVCQEAPATPKTILKPRVRKDCHRPSILLSVLP